MIIGECDDTGTTVVFKADPTIFEETTTYDFDVLKDRLRELAFLTRGVKIIVNDERHVDEEGKIYEMYVMWEFNSRCFYSLSLL